MNKLAAFAIGVAPFVAVGAGVVAARLMPTRALEAGFLAGQSTSSCVEIPLHTFPDLPTYSAGHAGLKPWSLEIYAATNPPSCQGTSFLGLDGDVECAINEHALVWYSNPQSGAHLYAVNAIGEHRVRANQRGLSCRQMN